GVAVDGSGNVYVADSGNGAVKEMPPGCASSSCVTTLGSGFSYPEGVTVDGSGNVYVADWGNGAVKEMQTGCTASSFNNGTCTITTLGGGFGDPSSVAVDGGGNVFVADSGNSAVKEMPPGCTAYSYNNGTCTITTLGGGFSQPSGVAVDGGGNVYVADWGNDAVKEMPPGCAATQYNNGTCAIATLGGGFDLPYGVAVDGGGNVYVADSGNNAAKQINRASPPSLSFAESNVGTESSDSPQTVTLDNVGNAALAFPVPSSGNSPSISTGFQLDSSTTCPQLSTSSSTATLAATASCVLAVDFVPTAPGSITGSLVLTDNNLNAAAPGYATQTISLSGTGRGAQITLSPASLAAATYGTSYSVTITASGGTAPYTYSVSTGSLPTGLTLSASGTISGAPTETGTYSFTIKAIDSNRFTGLHTYTLTVNAAATSTSLNVSPATVAQGQPVTLTATVTANTGPTPAGTVTFYLTGAETTSPTATLNASGVASVNLSTLPTGIYHVYAAYAGTSNDSPSSSSPPLTFTVTLPATQTVLTASPNPATFGASVTFTATVSNSASTPTGTVAFYDGTTLLETETLAAGVAAFSTSALSAGSHDMTAVYTPTAAFSASKSPVLIEVVSIASFSIAATPNSRSVYTGEAAAYSVKVTPASGFALPVALTCSQLPANTVCKFSPASVSGGSGSSSLVIQTESPSPSATKSTSLRAGQVAAFAALLLFMTPKRLRRKARIGFTLIAFFVFFALSAAVTACSGGGSLSGGTPAGSYTILVTGTASNGVDTISQNTTVILHVNSLF
ncbi:MAG: Ig-like domain repeat protein, partial [Terracidiphilus sp.]